MAQLELNFPPQVIPSVEYVDFNAHTDAPGNVEPPICAVTLAVSYSDGWSFAVSNLRVDYISEDA